MRLAAGCFGKLPIHGDFIRHNVGPEVDRIDEWLQGGIVSSRTTLGGAWDASFDATRPQRFLYQASGGRLVAGVIAPSIDKAGRRYPFLVFVILDAHSVGKDPTALPAILSSFFARSEGEARTGWQGLDLKSFLIRIDSLALPGNFEDARQPVAAFVAEETTRALWNAMFGSDQDPRKYLLIHNLVETLTPGAVPRYALRLSRVNRDPEVSFWLELCRTLSRRPALPTLSMWGGSRDGGEPGLTLVFDELKVNYFMPFWWPERKSNLLFPLADAPSASDPRLLQARDRYALILGDGAMPLSALMGKLAR